MSRVVKRRSRWLVGETNIEGVMDTVALKRDYGGCWALAPARALSLTKLAGNRQYRIRVTTELELLPVEKETP